ncbi:MAG: hypothetical protein PHQ81_05130 [Methanofollis sp.]|nr:hypothetical protein [Methanofollis sp.]
MIQYLMKNSRKIICIFIVFSLVALLIFIAHPGNILDIRSPELQEGYGDLDTILSRSESLLFNDSGYQKLTAGNETIRLLVLVHNRSCVEERYRIGFHYEEISGSRAARIVGGDYWRVLIDPGKGTVQSEMREWQPRHSCVNISSQTIKKGASSSLSSSTHVTVYPAPWLEDSGTWRYVLRVDSEGDVTPVKIPPLLSGWSGCIESLCSIWKVQGGLGDYLDIVKYSPDRVQTWCNADGEILIDEVFERDYLSARFSYPREGWFYGDWPSEAGYSYRFSINPKAGSRMVIDIVTALSGTGDGYGSDETQHSWRVIIDTPPDPAGLSENKLKANGIWATNYGGYYHLSPLIVDMNKGDTAALV